ncbi:MAG: dipeptidase E, partial [Oscillospiraceae bacterium]|nr:dipeptidase E [Oscillospiraceae bacterium]
MTYFLTSSPCVVGACRFNNINGFYDALKAELPNPCRGVYVASSPDDREKNEFRAGEMRDCFEAGGFRFTDWTLLDRRTAHRAAELVGQAQFILLSGGHVPTQNRFFRDIGLRELLEGFEGVVMGISAGSMNSADVVYAQPELPGEAT